MPVYCLYFLFVFGYYFLFLFFFPSRETFSSLQSRCPLNTARSSRGRASLTRAVNLAFTRENPGKKTILEYWKRIGCPILLRLYTHADWFMCMSVKRVKLDNCWSVRIFQRGRKCVFILNSTVFIWSVCVKMISGIRGE